MPAGHSMTDIRITVMGAFVADLAFRATDLPAWGQTMLGTEFRLGPGGKGSNQAVAAARLGASVSFITKLGQDPFGELARRTYRDERIDDAFTVTTPDHPTGGAAIIVHAEHGENAIVVVPGASWQLSPADVDRAASRIAATSVFLTQLELPLSVVAHGLGLARAAGARTILNPAPACALPDDLYPLCDYLTPNETEAAALAGQPIVSVDDAERAADTLLARGARHVIVTLGARGALVRTATQCRLVPAVDAGPAVDTTGAGDAFNGGFAVALAEGRDVVAAAEFGCAVAALSVTRPGTAPSMPLRSEVDALIDRR
jgi:ribokinase